MGAHANFQIVENTATSLTIEDLGPWDVYLTVTNDAEWVVKQVASILDGRRLFYRDSEGGMDEIVVEQGRFSGFRVYNDG
jgi:hypothetical protein